MAAGRPGRRAATAWVLYDLANTIFSFAIVSTFFPLWLNQDVGLPDSFFAVASSASMLVVLFIAPALGVLSDQVRRRIPFLVASTLACVVPTVFLGTVPWPAAVLLFVVANVGFQSGLVFYDALLPLVSTPSTRGRIGGLGVGVGYLGSILALGLGRLILSGDESRDAVVFAAAGGMFLLFALPAFFLIREPKQASRALTTAAVLGSVTTAFGRLRTVLGGRDVPYAGRFLLSRALYADAANTMILFMGLYAVNEAGFTEASVALVLAVGIVGALVSAPLWGALVDRMGPKHALDVVLALWMLGLIVVSLMPVLQLASELFYVVAFVLGAALAGTWTADRPLLVAIAPAGRVGEFFGYYAMVGRFAAIVGPLLWALIVDVAHWGRPTAVFTLAVLVFVAFLAMRRVPDPVKGSRSPMNQFLPYRDDAGRPLPQPPGPWWTRIPGTLTYAFVTSSLFLILLLRYRRDLSLVPAWLDSFFAYRIHELFTRPLNTLLHFFTSVWVNHHPVQLFYVLVLLAAFGMWFEAREGTKRAALVFFATSIAAGIVAGILAHVVGWLWDPAWLAALMQKPWVGGSAGAFGLAGATAARARRPWLIMGVLTAWELNVEWWHLRNYTIVFHSVALATGWWMARRLPGPGRRADPRAGNVD